MSLVNTVKDIEEQHRKIEAQHRKSRIDKMKQELEANGYIVFNSNNSEPVTKHKATLRDKVVTTFLSGWKCYGQLLAETEEFKRLKELCKKKLQQQKQFKKGLKE